MTEDGMKKIRELLAEAQRIEDGAKDGGPGVTPEDFARLFDEYEKALDEGGFDDAEKGALLESIYRFDPSLREEAEEEEEEEAEEEEESDEEEGEPGEEPEPEKEP